MHTHHRTSLSLPLILKKKAKNKDAHLPKFPSLYNPQSDLFSLITFLVFFCKNKLPFKHTSNIIIILLSSSISLHSLHDNSCSEWKYSLSWLISMTPVPKCNAKCRFFRCYVTHKLEASTTVSQHDNVIILTSSFMCLLSVLHLNNLFFMFIMHYS